MKVLASIVGVILYFVLAWAIKDILLASEWEWVWNMRAWSLELLIAAVAGTIAANVSVSINAQNLEIIQVYGILGLFVFGIIALIFSFIPISMGAVVIFNMINIGLILFCAISDEHKPD